MWGAPYITSVCPRYSTEVIRDELYRKFPEFRTEILPPYFGGAPTDLLVGGEEIRLAPESFCSLYELGVRLYRSPFVDIQYTWIVYSL